MTIIDGINVASWECDKCGTRELWLFRGQNGEGYKFVCAKCHIEDRELIDEMELPYLWGHKEMAK